MRNTLKVGSDFSGVGAFNQALKRLGVNYEELFACDMDKYARKVFIHNYGEPKYYPEDVYKREIPTEPLDIYMTSPPCQAFSLAGKRKGEEDKRGVLFYNSHEFIRENKPRYFIFENVKGLLSDDGGKTFARWIDYLGGKSVNGNPVIFPHEDSVSYHVYYKVLNAKNYGVPQNRERVFIIGIRDDTDNNFSFPKEIPLTKRLKDVLEKNVDEKYFLSDKMIKGLTGIDVNSVSKTIRVGGRSSKSDKHNWDLIKVGYINQDTQASQVYSDEGIGQTLCAGTHGYANGYVKIKSATSKGYEIAEIGVDSLNFEHPNSKTRRGRVGVGVGQTLTASCDQGVILFDTPKVKFQLTGGKWDKTHEQSGRVYDKNGIAPTIHTMQGGNQEPKVAIGAIRGRNPDNPKSRRSGLETVQMLEINENDTANCLTTVQKDNVVIEQRARGYNKGSIFELAPSITCNSWQENNILHQNYRIRKLTPRECFRLMDFPDSFDFSCVSDSQAYKQAGNSIVVNVLCEVLIKLLKIKKPR